MSAVADDPLRLTERAELEWWRTLHTRFGPDFPFEVGQPTIGSRLRIIDDSPRGEILAFAGRRTNAEAIRDLAALGYLKPDDGIIDLTYGLGRFWTLWQPKENRLKRADLNPELSPDFELGLDATDTNFPDQLWDVVVVDPPYKLNGTSEGRGPSASDVDYGVDGDYHSVASKHHLMLAMLTEAHRIVKRNGYIIYKCQDQVNGGRTRQQERMIANAAEELGAWHLTTLFVEGARAQPSHRPQKTPRNNFSSMLVIQRKAR